MLRWTCFRVRGQRNLKTCPCTWPSQKHAHKSELKRLRSRDSKLKKLKWIFLRMEMDGVWLNILHDWKQIKTGKSINANYDKVVLAARKSFWSQQRSTRPEIMCHHKHKAMKTYVRNIHMFAAPFLDRRKSCPQQLMATNFNQFRFPNTCV